MSAWDDSDVWAGHYRRYEKTDLEKLFQKHNFIIEKLFNYGFPACLILDKIRCQQYRKKMKNEVQTPNKEDASKRSGVERTFHPIFRFLSHPFFQWPFIKLSELFYHTDWGTGYLLIDSKKQQH